MDARKVRGLEPALNGRMRAVKAESLALVVLGCSLSRLSLRPRHTCTCGTLQQAQVRSSSPLAGSFRFDQLSARPFLFFYHLAECITPGDLVVWKRRKGTCWMGPNRDILIYKSLPILFPFQHLLPSNHCPVIWILEWSTHPENPDSLGSIEAFSLFTPTDHLLKLSFSVRP